LASGSVVLDRQRIAAWQRLLPLLRSAAAVKQQPAQPQQQGSQSCWSPKHPRNVDLEPVPAPNFRLAAVAIGKRKWYGADKVPSYFPDFTRCVDHFCLHAGECVFSCRLLVGNPVIIGIEVLLLISLFTSGMTK
jgi:hypothetical protein